MKLLILLILVIIGYSVSGQAQEETNPRYEIAVTPLFGYSSSNGLALGANLGIGYTLAGRWQVVSTFASYAYTRSGAGRSEYTAGFQYNFSQDFRASSFLGAGWGEEESFDSARRPYLYVRYGYRWLISKGSGVSWAPTITVGQTYNEGNRTTGNKVIGYIEPLRFSKSF